MTIQHGVNITASDMKNMLESTSYYNGENSWQKLYGSAALSYQNQSDQLLKTYGDTIASAYKSSLQQQNALYDLGLTQGDTQELQGIARQELMATYQNYLSNYQSAQNELANAYAQEKGLYDEALMTESENYANLYNSAMTYYENVLKGATHSENDLSKPIYSGKGKEAQATGEYEQKITSLVDEYGLDWLMKKAEDGSMVALSRDELMNKMFDQDGAITEYGRNFYDMVFNHAATVDGYYDAEGNQIVSFDKWLSDNDNDLYNWLHSADTFNYTHQGTKLGSAKEYVGLDSTDEKFNAYQMIEGAISTLDKISNNLRTDYDYIANLNELDLDKISKFDKYTGLIHKNESYTDDTQLDFYAQSNIQHYYKKLSPIVEAYNKESSALYNEVDTILKAFGDDIYEKYKTELDKIYSDYGTLLSDLTSEQIGYLTEKINSGNNYFSSAHITQMTGKDARTYQRSFENAYNIMSSGKFREKLDDLLKKVYDEAN